LRRRGLRGGAEITPFRFPPCEGNVIELRQCVALSGLKILLNPYPRAIALGYTLSALRALPQRENRSPLIQIGEDAIRPTPVPSQEGNKEVPSWAGIFWAILI